MCDCVPPAGPEQGKLKDFLYQRGAETIRLLQTVARNGSDLCTDTRVPPKIALALGQVAFIDYVVQPLFAAAQKIFPEVSELEANCRSNREAWRALGARASADRASADV